MIQSNESANQQAIGIAEKVKFRQEQDKINQELIPRVIRQNDLLTAHIKDHESLPIIAAAAAPTSRRTAVSTEIYDAISTFTQEITNRLLNINPDLERVGGIQDGLNTLSNNMDTINRP